MSGCHQACQRASDRRMPHAGIRNAHCAGSAGSVSNSQGSQGARGGGNLLEERLPSSQHQAVAPPCHAERCQAVYRWTILRGESLSCSQHNELQICMTACRAGSIKQWPCCTMHTNAELYRLEASTVGQTASYKLCLSPTNQQHLLSSQH